MDTFLFAALALCLVAAVLAIVRETRLRICLGVTESPIAKKQPQIGHYKVLGRT